MRYLSTLFTVVVCMGLFLAGPALAQDQEAGASPEIKALITAETAAIRSALGDQETNLSADLDVPAEDLALLVQPLTKADVETELAYWIKALQLTAQAHNRFEIELKKAGEDAAKAAELNAMKDAFSAKISDLVDRCEVVKDDLVTKGGEVEETDKYLAIFAGSMTDDLPDLSSMDADWIMNAVNDLKDWLTATDGGIKWGAKILLFIVILILAKIVSIILGSITAKALSKLKRTSELLRDFFVNTVKKLTMFIGFIIALTAVDINVGPFLAAMGMVGFIVGFALQGTLSNFASGIMILLYRPYDIGDAVSVAGVAGKVASMTLVSTTIKTFDNQKVVVPNSSIWGDVITNITGSEKRRVDLVFGIGYSDDIEKAQKILEEILTSHPKVLKDPAPVVKLHELADSSVNFVTRPWCNTGDYWDVYWDVTRTVKERFDAEGVSIPFPQRDIHVFNETNA